MSQQWPEDWFRGPSGSGSGHAPGPGQPGEVAGPSDPTVQVPMSADTITVEGGGHAGAWPAQPPTRSEPPGSSPGSPPGLPPGPPPTRRRRWPLRFGSGGWRVWLRPRRLAALLAILLALLIVGTISTYFYLNGKLDRQNVLVAYPGRPAPGAGTNWLITGSDSRQGLTRAEENRLATGHDISGHRSDTILVLHISAGGSPDVLLSIPRDSYVDIPGHGYNKINAAFAFGGPKLLAKTIQNATGLYINHYMGIGFGGFVDVVNAIGGVRMCLPGPLSDPKAGIHLAKGCHNLDGGTALGFVRTRNFAISDLQRVQDQRLFLRALLSKMTSAGTMLNPFAILPAADSAASTLTVDQNTSLYQLVQVAFAMRHPVTTTVPIANANYFTSAGDSVLWNKSEAHRLFADLAHDRTLPKSLITGSKLVPSG